MSKLENLEDFRMNDYLSVCIALLSDSSAPKIEITYNTYAMHAFYSSIDDINDLENEENFINNGRRALVTVSLWYLALESYVNSLVKTVAVLKNCNTEEVVNKELAARITYLAENLKYDILVLKKTGVYNRVNEFREYRNEIFHDRYHGTQKRFKKTFFSSIPKQSNQVDIMQAAKIFLEVVSFFRYAIPGLDLMPNISIGNQSILHFDKLDILYKKILNPYFRVALSKRNLKTLLNTDISNLTSLGESKLFVKGEVVIISRYQQDDKFTVPEARSKSFIGADLYKKTLQEYNLEDGHVSGMNFVIDWQDLYQSHFPMRR